MKQNYSLVAHNFDKILQYLRWNLVLNSKIHLWNMVGSSQTEQVDWRKIVNNLMIVVAAVVVGLIVVVAAAVVEVVVVADTWPHLKVNQNWIVLILKLCWNQMFLILLWGRFILPICGQQNYFENF